LTGIVHKDVDPAEPAPHLMDQIADVFRLLHVRRDGDRAGEPFPKV